MLGTDLKTQRYLSPSDLRKQVKLFINKIYEQKVFGTFKEEISLMEKLMKLTEVYFEDKAKKL